MNLTNAKIQNYNKQVGLKFQLYNSLFTALPFHRVEKTGVLLSTFLLHCEEGYNKQQSPVEIIDTFFQQYTSYQNEQEQIDLLFRFVQYAERQVVLFDAVEDAAFGDIYDLNGIGTLKHLQSEVLHSNKRAQLAEKLKDFSVRLVLTAHPTQFYPSEVLGIINDLSNAIIRDNTAEVNSFLQQLGKTPFFKKEKPTPYDEAVNLIWFLQNRFYPAAGRIMSNFKNQFQEEVNEENPLIRLGFWPGGDRDGNPYVKVNTTLKVAAELRTGILNAYYIDVHQLKSRLTFKGVSNVVASLEEKIHQNLSDPNHHADLTKEEIISTLKQIRTTLMEQHNGLFQEMVENLLRKVELFGLYFATLDIRQDSSVHSELMAEIAQHSSALPDNYTELSEAEKIDALLNIQETLDPSIFENELFRDTLETISAIKTIQKRNGENGCHRYIISHSTSALDVMHVYGLFKLGGWKTDELKVDIVPLFESIEDLRNAAKVMKTLYENEAYRKHLSKRNNIQTIMVGFSDGTKDGGYLMANFSIYKAKEALTQISKEYGIQVVFFDGRGGPPARGGGRTHQFYASLGSNIANKEIQLTIQGQTISSNFGTVDSAQFNMEQLMHAGISNALFYSDKLTQTKEEDDLLLSLSEKSYEAYNALKNHPGFLEYLNEVSPLRYYGQANIGSRPSKRKPGKLNLDDLRAVPYVGSWSQLKQNLPGYYGVGIALEKLEAEGKWEEVRQLYQSSLFFKTLMDNCEMAMCKSFFPLTAFLAEHPKYGALWTLIHEEFQRTKTQMLKLAGTTHLMEDKPINRLSIQMRQRIELPLLTIQQYALNKIREVREGGSDSESANMNVYEKMVVRCSFGIINAGRNSA
ncbi:phosphoenolpyruvate carboxylase [Catalinimonas alkaloidigena]|uniref:phosphoenolpyruvate carboxylase n=1 Tax=Catalinimonas alkaloidigena TaxID=1075417 RepID=UPI00240602BC|nr:phosphoenolpyruvate carboxylase [Catalinimonas alkaloidigena]MDF9800354.1 phosphoenolpyruvate carboxylase [Catalinimonas alkaloidigena]